MKREQEGFRFKSFMVEMVLAHLQDSGARLLGLSRGAPALLHLHRPQQFRRAHPLLGLLRAVGVGVFSERVKIIDPVNAQNNISSLYTAQEADAIVDAALDAGDAIDAALAAPTKQQTVIYWQKIFGSSFQV